MSSVRFLFFFDILNTTWCPIYGAQKALANIMKNERIDLEFLAQLAMEAGRAILEVYGTEFTVEQKEDRSPLTLADRKSHRIIVEGLHSRYPDIPILSEEGRETHYSTRRAWRHFWCVDPLDGTKEFIRKNGEFTVNIALIEGQTPVTGIIHVPVKGDVFVARIHDGAWRIRGENRERLSLNGTPTPEIVRVLKSRSHPSAQLEALLEAIPQHEAIQRGSALKFCSIASGEAHFYPRLGPTMEWDTAAGQVIVTAAGGVMVDFKGNPFTYNKPELVNRPFLAAFDEHWLSYAGVLQKAASLSL